jgi:Fe2+ transport system protein B
MLNSKLTSQSFTVSANPKCGNCNKTVYAMEQQKGDINQSIISLTSHKSFSLVFFFFFFFFFFKGAGKIYHKLCFKCQLCNSKIEPGFDSFPSPIIFLLFFFS